MDNQLTYLIQKAIEAALLGGEKIMAVYQKDNFGIAYKDDKSPVTVADKESSKVIIDVLKETNIPFLCEEEKIVDFDTRKKWNHLWIIDPLDGTKEFIKQNGEFCVNIAYVKNNIPVFGIIYIPTTQELFWGGKELGAFKLNGTSKLNANIKELAITLPCFKNKDKIVVAGSRSHGDDHTTSFYKELKINHNNIVFMKVGSAIKFCRVAEGKIDYYPRFNPCMEWDTAAGHAIVQGVGKDVFNVKTNKSLVYNKEDLYSPFFILK